MLFSYIKLALRNLNRFKTNTVINISGLAIGLASAILIFLYILHEVSYDSFFNESDRIYRVYLKGKLADRAIQSAISPLVMANALQKDFEEIEHTTRVLPPVKTMLKKDDLKFIENQFYFVDSSFFNLFNFEVKYGEIKDALVKQKSIVLTERLSEKLFGTGNPVGKKINVFNDTTEYTVTAVIQNPPENSHFRFNCLGSIHSLDLSGNELWLSNTCYTYLKIKKNIDYKELEDKLPQWLVGYIEPEINRYFEVTANEFIQQGQNEYLYYLQPLQDVHLNPDINHGLAPPNNKRNIFLMALAAMLIILMACINFINLLTAKSATRAQEIGVRKVLGANKPDLIFQFLGESVVTALFGTLIALILVEVMLPQFNAEFDIKIASFFSRWWILPSIFLFGILVGIIAGIYPALHLSSFLPLRILRQKSAIHTGTKMLRSTLVFTQFFISVVILLTTVVIYRQINYMLETPKGYDEEKLYIIERANILGAQKEKFKNELIALSGVENASFSSSIPGFPNRTSGFNIEGKSLANTILIDINYADGNFLKTYGLQLIDGYDFPGDTTDSLYILLNERTIDFYNLENPLQQRLSAPEEANQRTYFQIRGIMKDFFYESLHEQINPYILMHISYSNFNNMYLTLRLDESYSGTTLKEISMLWNNFTLGYPMESYFLDDKLNELYKDEYRAGKLYFFFTILSVFVACLGLYGLIAFTSGRKTREIAIRKIMGADTWQIVVQLIREIAMILIIASAIGWVFVWIAMNRLLMEYAYHITMEPAFFLAGISTLIIISIVTIFFQAYRAASRNPAYSMKHD